MFDSLSFYIYAILKTDLFDLMFVDPSIIV